MSRIRVKDIDVIEMSGQTLQVRLWGRVFLLQMESEVYKQEFLRMLKLLDGHHDTEDVIAGRALPPEEARTILATLRDLALTESVELEQASGEVPSEGYLQEHAALFRVFESAKVKSSVECQRRVFRQRIALVDGDPLSDELGRLLPRYGFRQVRRISREAVALEAGDASELMLVPLTSYRDDELLQVLNRRSMERAQTLMPVTFDDGIAQIGPTVVPGKTACLRCLDLRITSNIDNQEAHSTYRAFVAASGRGYPDIPAHLTTVSVFVCHELLRVATGYDQAKSYNGILKVDLWNGEVRRSRVLKFPSCNVCSARARKPKYDSHAFVGMLSRL